MYLSVACEKVEHNKPHNPDKVQNIKHLRLRPKLCKSGLTAAFALCSTPQWRHNGCQGSPEMGKNKNWQSTFLDTLVARKHRNISNIGKVKGSRKSTKFSTPFLCTQKSLNFTMIKRPWQRAQNRKL